MKCEHCQGRGFTELEHGIIMVECEVCKGSGVIGDSGIERDNQPVGSADTSKPKQPQKPKAKKKARRASR